jgi:hypothetical protein
MKGGTEHKILRFLKDNENGDFINVTNLIEDRKLLESKLQSLAKEPEKYISVRFPVFFFGVGIPNKENNELKAKIEINGIILLDQIENGDKNTTENIFNGNFNGNFIHDSEFKKARIINKPKNVNNTPLKKSLIEKIISHPWMLLIVGALIAALLNSDRIMRFINEIMDGL